MSYINPMRKMLNEHENILGAHICMREPVATEILASMYDFLWIDWEHTWMDRTHIMNHLIAAKAGGAASLVRVPWNDPILAKPILEMGPDGVIFPQIHSLEEAKAAIASCTYPPDGERGWGPIRAVNYGALPAQQYIAENRERTFIILQIENTDIIKDLPEIAKLPGLGALCWGPMDMSASLGKLGQINDPEVVAVYDQVAEILKGTDVPLMVSFGYVESSLMEWKRRGVRIFSVDSDVNMIFTHGKQNIEKLNPMLGREGKANSGV